MASHLSSAPSNIQSEPIPRRWTYNDIQQSIDQLSQAWFKEQNLVIGMHSQTCCTCGYVMFDEEVLSFWCGLYSSKTRRDSVSLSNTLQFRSMSQMHQIKCNSCSEKFTPQLTINAFQKADNFDELSQSLNDLSPLTNHRQLVSTKWTLTVNYLSPHGLRHAIEAIMQYDGFQIINAKYFSSKYPELYWNLLWYTQRMNLPSGLIWQDDSDCETSADMKQTFSSPIVVGWREHLVQAKAGLLFLNKPKDSLSLYDYFPGITSRHVSELEAAADHMDTALAGMRDMLLKLADVIQDRAILEVTGLGVSFARSIYISMLCVSLYFKKNRLILPLITEIPVGLSKVRPIDNSTRIRITY